MLPCSSACQCVWGSGWVTESILSCRGKQHVFEWSKEETWLPLATSSCRWTVWRFQRLPLPRKRWQRFAASPCYDINRIEDLSWHRKLALALISKSMKTQTRSSFQKAAEESCNLCFLRNARHLCRAAWAPIITSAIKRAESLIPVSLSQSAVLQQAQAPSRRVQIISAHSLMHSNQFIIYFMIIPRLQTILLFMTGGLWFLGSFLHSAFLFWARSRFFIYFPAVERLLAG